LKFSVIVPYKQRLDNVALVFESLVNQTLPSEEFEVVVGAMEYCERYVALCRRYSERLAIVSVLSADPWQVARARNLALRQATGEVLLLLDADLVLPPTFLADLYERHFSYRQKVCVVGQMLDYDNNTSDVEGVVVKPYQHYEKLLIDLAARGDIRDDPRMAARHVIPWSFAWTALIALPSALVREHDLWFDPEFHGYGVEDLEWAYRVCATGTPIIMGHDVYGIHLPHVRNVAANRDAEAANYRRFLRKWPGKDVELACAFGDFAANEAYVEFRGSVSRAAGPGGSLAIAAGRHDGVDTLVVGLVTTEGIACEGFDPGCQPEVLPVTGIALPYPDDSFASCVVLPPILRLDDRFRDRVLAEARRVSRGLVTRSEGL
jgi:glycosyltransferase involved in cell wall biosynthesis